MLSIRRPYHLSEEEADRWINVQAAPLALGARPGSVELSHLQNPAARGGGDWDWLIEMHCDDVEEADRLARGKALRELVADLRLLGMRPTLELVDGTRPLHS